MRYVVLAITALLAFGASAQSTGWPVVERCVGEFNYPSIPPSRWDFDGTIVSRNEEGVRAIQAAEPQQYFIALAGVETFPFSGAFSPDGRWFAYAAIDGADRVLMVVPAGRADGETLIVPWPFDETAALTPHPRWETSAVVLIQHDDGQWYAIDRTENGVARPAETPPAISYGDAIAADAVDHTLVASYDGRRVAYTSVDALGRAAAVHYADLTDETIYDLCFTLPPSAAPIMAWSPDGTTLAFAVDGFPVLLNVETMENAVLRYETGDIMAWLPPPPVFKEGRG